jgi:diguanylate cyclase (GGDEF)-like protein
VAPAERLPPALLAALIDRINVGVVTVDAEMTILQWNRFMEAHSGQATASMVGQNLFQRFPELPREWLQRKIRSIFLLRTFAFSSWRNRPYLFPFKDHRLVTGDAEPMRQDCAFVPLVEGGAVQAVSIVLIDVTDTYQSQRRLDLALTDLAALSERDSLTGVFNRRKLEQVLDTELSRARRYDGALSVVMFDIDHFKRVNDQFGHLVGDETIRHVARTAVGTLRSNDVIGRYGGEEFVALLPEVALDGAVAAAERMRQAVAALPVPGAPRSLMVTVSLGVAAYCPDLPGTVALIDQADQALYRSKRGGRNRVTAFTVPEDATAAGG